MSVNATSPYETVRPGEDIGQFKLLSVNQKEIELEWHGKKVHKMVDELMDNSQTPAAAQQQQADAAAGRSAAPQPTTVQPPEPPSEKGPGESNQFGTAACQQNDSSPYGTVRDGYRKIERVTPFGHVCLWEQVGGK
jgi:hypothetical protein